MPKTISIKNLFLNIEDVATSENQRFVCKSLLLFYFIILIKENKSETENKYIDYERVNLQAVL